MSDRNNYWIRRVNSNRLSRRRFVGGAATAGAGAAGIALVGCGDDDDSPSPTTPAGPSDDGAADDSNGDPTATPDAPENGQTTGGLSRGVFLGGNVFDSADVHRAFGDPTSWLSNYVLSKLVRYDNPDAGTIEGDLAHDWEVIDAANYVFHLRDDVYWQDTPLTNGRQLTSEDVQWHFQRQALAQLADGTETDFRHSSFYQSVANIDTPDEFTVTVELASPNGTFIDRLAAYFSTIPNRETTEQYEADHRTITEDAMPATGAYRLRQWRANEDIQFEKNPDHFRTEEPLLDGWIYPMLFEDPNAHRIAFEQKQVDAFSSPDPSLTASIIAANPDDMWEVLTGVANTVYMNLNMNQQFSDVRLVRAMNLAFDRRGMFENFHQGLGQVSGPVTWLQEGFALVPDELVQHDGYRVDRDEDIQQARALWEEADGASLGEIDIKIPDTWLGPWPDSSQIIAAMFNETLGVNQFISSRTTYDEEIIPNLANGQFPNWFGWTSQVSGPDPRAGLFQSFHSTGSTNFQGVDNPELDTLLANALAEPDLEAAVELVRDAQRILLENGQYGNVILYNYINRNAGWNYFHGNHKVTPSGGQPGEGYNIFAGHLAPRNVWIDTNDPSYQGRPAVTL